MRRARGDLNITFRQTDVASEIRVALRCKMWQRSRINAAEARPHGVHGPLREKPWRLRYGESEVPAKKKKKKRGERRDRPEVQIFLGVSHPVYTRLRSLRVRAA